MPEFSATPTTSVYSGMIRLDGILRAQDQLSMLISGQRLENSHLGARSGVEPSATLHGNDRFELVHGHWTHRARDGSLWSLKAGFSHASPTDTLQAGVTAPNTTRLFTEEMTGAAPLETDSALSRFSLLGQGQILKDLARYGRHHLFFNVDLEESLATEDHRVFKGHRLFLYPETAPSEVAEFNSPSHAKQRLRELSLSAEDQMLIAGRLFVRFGLNLDSSSAWLPKQSSDSGPFVPARTFEGRGGVVSWTTFSPRAGFAVPLRGRLAGTRFLGGYSRYDHLLPAAYADFANPTALGGRIYRWVDSDRDGVFQPGEEGALLRNFGALYGSVDPRLKRPFTHEWGLGLAHDFGRGLAVSVLLLDRETRRLVHTINVGVPDSAYMPVDVLDPGEDGLTATRDDRVVTLYNRDPRTLGQDRYLLTNPPGMNARARGLEATVIGSASEHGFFSVSFAAYQSAGDGNPGNSDLENDTGVISSLFDDPNTRIHSRGRLFFDRAYLGKVMASYRAPLGLRFGTVIAYFDGLPFGRRLIIADANQGPFFVMATPRGQPGGFRTQYYLTFDQRVAREFELGRMRVSATVDVFNLLNLNKSLRESDITSPRFSERRPLDVENPRVIRLGFLLRF